MDGIRVGIIGMGFIGKLHLDALRRLDGVEVSAVSTSHPNAEFGCRICNSWQEIIDDPSIDAVHNCLPQAMHREVNIAAMAAGKHIYSEKPLGMDTSDAMSQLKALKEHPVAAAIGHQYRANAAVAELRERIRSGSAGKVLFFSGRYFQDSLAHGDDYSERRLPENSPARTLSDLGSHLLDLSVHVLGSRIRKVMALMQTHYSERQGHPIHSDDTTFLLVEMENGVCGTLSVSKAAHGHKNDLFLSVSCSEEELSWSQEMPDRLSIWSREKGNAVLFPDSRIFSDKASRLITLPAGHVMGWADALRNSMALFYGSIRDGSWKGDVDYATFADGCHVSAAIDAAVLSSSSGRWEEVEA